MKISIISAIVGLCSTALCAPVSNSSIVERNSLSERGSSKHEHSQNAYAHGNKSHGYSPGKRTSSFPLSSNLTHHIVIGNKHASIPAKSDEEEHEEDDDEEDDQEDDDEEDDQEEDDEDGQEDDAAASESSIVERDSLPHSPGKRTLLFPLSGNATRHIIIGNLGASAPAAGDEEEHEEDDDEEDDQEEDETE